MGVILDGPANTVHTHFRRAEHEKHAQLLERIYQGLGDAANHLPDDLNHPEFHAPSGFCEPAGRSVTCSE
jgi:hypothetical protein